MAMDLQVNGLEDNPMITAIKQIRSKFHFSDDDFRSRSIMMAIIVCGSGDGRGKKGVGRKRKEVLYREIC